EPTRGVLTIPGEIVFTYEFLPGDIKLSGDSLLNCRTLAGSLGQYVDFDLDLRSRQLVVNSGPIPVMNQKLFAKASGAVPASRTLREWAIYLHLYKRKYRMRETNSTEFMDVLTVHDGNTKILLPNKKSIYIQHQRSIPGVNCERKMKAMLEFDEAKDPDWVEYTVHFKNNGSIAFSATGENVNSKIKDFILHPLD
ncbi:MAG: hypothetical protein K0Q66_736, partial [Chitinophagaceae bacterium]|nr:hypothetical protein [Chitinophagaceae bacterium]